MRQETVGEKRIGARSAYGSTASVKCSLLSEMVVSYRLCSQSTSNSNAGCLDINSRLLTLVILAKLGVESANASKKDSAKTNFCLKNSDSNKKVKENKRLFLENLGQEWQQNKEQEAAACKTLFLEHSNLITPLQLKKLQRNKFKNTSPRMENKSVKTNFTLCLK